MSFSLLTVKLRLVQSPADITICAESWLISSFFLIFPLTELYGMFDTMRCCPVTSTLVRIQDVEFLVPCFIRFLLQEIQAINLPTAVELYVFSTCV